MTYPIYQNYHKHTYYTNIMISDSTVSYEDYAKRALELGQGVLTSVEHGWQGRYYETYEVAKRYGLKFIFGTEAYWVLDRTKRDMANCHICLLARNEAGRREINRILSEANVSGFYRVPRIDIELLLSLNPRNVFITTACIGFFKYGLEQSLEIVKLLSNKFEDSFYLEVQYHNFDRQKEINSALLALKLPIILGTDSHYIYPEQHQERDNFLYARGLNYSDEKDFIIDYPDTKTVIERFQKQGVLNTNQIEEAINNTNILLTFEDIEFDKEIKLPDSYDLPQEEKNTLLKTKVYNSWDTLKEDIPKTKHKLYESEIAKELSIIENTKMADYFLIDNKIVNRATSKGGIITSTGRGCFTEEALIHTKETMKQIKDIQIGDEVISSDGNFHKVINKFKYCIEEEMIQIQHLYGTNKFYPTICTKDHKILINRNSENVWIEAQNIENTDFVCVPKIKTNDLSKPYIDLNDYNDFGYEYDENYIYEYKPYTNNEYEYSPSSMARLLNVGKSMMENFANGKSITNVRKKEVYEKFYEVTPFKTQEEYVKYIRNKRTLKINRYIKNDKIHNTFIGLMYGDGVNPQSKYTEISLAINNNPDSHKNHINRKIFSIIAERLNLKIYENMSKNRSLSQLYINSKIFKNYISKELFVSKKDKCKIFNANLFNQSQENLLGILEGLKYSDGSDKEQYERISFDNTSPSLINTYKILCLITSTGVNSLSIREAHIDSRGYNNKASYKLRMNPNAKIVQKKAERIKEDNNFWYLPIKKIIKLNNQKVSVYDISVEGMHDYLINNMIVHNSGVSFYTNTLLGFSKVDRISAKVKMYPERFMSETRILETKSLPDLDLNTGNPEVFLEAQKEILGEHSSYQMIAFGTFKVKSAFKLYAKSQNLDFTVANIITTQLDQFEKDYKYADEDTRELLNVYDYVDKGYWKYIDESKKYQNIISDKKPHPCASLIYKGDIREELGIIKIKDVLCTVIDGQIAENYKFLKNDLLKVDVVNIIDRVYKRIGVRQHTVNELIEITKNDKKTWDIYAKGLTVCINQCEKESTRQKIMKYKPQNISELTAFVAAIRPSFQSMYATFEARENFTYGIPEFDKLIQTDEIKDSFILYQEQIMATLNFAGIDNSETYGIIKAIAKKKEDKVLKWKEIFLEGFTKKSDEASALKVWKIIEDSCAYGFNASHAYCVACDSLYEAYLKANYPLEFFTEILNYYAEKNEKDKLAEIKNELCNFGITINPISFRDDNRIFTLNKNNNSIYESMVSIKTLNKQISKELYKLRDENFNSIIDLFLALKTRTNIQCNQLDILIRLDYFREFGAVLEIQEYLRIFDLFWQKSSKNFRQQVNKNNITKLGLNKAIIEHNSQERDKSYTKLDCKNIIRELYSLLPPIPQMQEIDVIKTELELLGYIRYKTDFKTDRHRVFVLEINYGRSEVINPKVKIYSIGTGKIAILKIKRRLVNFKEHDIIKIKKLIQKPRYIYIGEENGEPQFEVSKTDKEWWIESYGRP